jgi:hypothetical protein
VPLITCPKLADKEGVRGKPGIPNSGSPGTMTSIDLGPGETSPMMTSQGELELGPHKAPPVQSRLRTRASGALAGSQSGENLELPKCVSYSKKIAMKVRGQAPRVAGLNEVHLHTNTRWTVAGSPWYGPSWEEAQIPQGKKRASWPRRPMVVEPATNLGIVSRLLYAAWKHFLPR